MIFFQIKVIPVIVGLVIAILIFIVVCYRKDDESKENENSQNLTPAELARRKQLSKLKSGSQEPLLPSNAGPTKVQFQPQDSLPEGYEYDPANPDQPRVKEEAIFTTGASKEMEGQHNKPNMICEEGESVRKRSSVLDRA